MVKVPEDVKAKIKALADKLERPLEELQKRFQEIMKDDPTIASMDVEPEVKMRVAVGTLIRENVVTGGGSDFYVRIVSKSAIRIVGKDRKRVADVYAIARELDDEGNLIEEPDGSIETKYAVMTLWDEATEGMKKLEQEKVYKTNLIKTPQQWGMVLSSNNAQFSEVDIEMPTLEEFYKNEIESMDIKIDIASADLNVSDPKTPTDIRILQGTVIRPRKGVDRNGKEYAVYGIIDGNSVDEFTVWTTPDMMRYGVGSDCSFIGQVMKDQRSGVISMNAHFVLPAREHSVTPLRLEVKPVGGDGPKQADIPASVPEERDEEAEEKTDSEPEF